MKRLSILLLAASLAGCASLPAPVAKFVPHHQKVQPPPSVTVVPTSPVPPATFKLRFNAFKSRHPHIFRPAPK